MMINGSDKMSLEEIVGCEKARLQAFLLAGGTTNEDPEATIQDLVQPDCMHQLAPVKADTISSLLLSALTPLLGHI